MELPKLTGRSLIYKYIGRLQFSAESDTTLYTQQKHSTAPLVRPNWVSVRQQTSLLSQLFQIEQNVQQSANNIALLIGIHRGAWFCPRCSQLLPALFALYPCTMYGFNLISSGVFSEITKGMFCSHPSSSQKENHDFQFLEELVGNFSLKKQMLYRIR